MACQPSTSQEIEELQKHTERAIKNRASIIELLLPQSDTKKVKLQRGGTVVFTKAGPIQFSMVPETVKDCLTLGIEVPTIFIMPTHRFDIRFCLSVAEFEFPAYFNFFVKKKKIVLVCDKIGEAAVRSIFQETLLGPRDLSAFAEDFVTNYKGMPDIARELAHFAKNPFNPTEDLKVETLISFANFTNGVAELGNGVQVRKEDQRLFIIEDGNEIAKIKDKVDILIDTDTTQEYIKYGLFSSNDDNLDFSSSSDEEGTNKVEFVEQQFDPPIFGITLLGCSHGFDPKGSTSGYIIWVNKRGVMVDPPPYSTLLLRKMGIPSKFVRWIIISHTHADHDAGAFQKLLESEKIELITTRTIMESFVRKYSALTDLPQEYIKTLFDFRPVKIGHATRVNGAEFQFFYALHSIPTVGFYVKILDKSIYFSGDTYYDPEGLLKLYEKGVLTKERYEFLVSDEKWNHTVVLHEAGVPPIHTPMKALASLSEEVKSRLLLVHVAEKDVPANSNLRISKTGIENTLIIIKDDADQKLNSIRELNLIQNIHIFQKASFKHIRGIYEVTYDIKVKSGESIFKEGDPGVEFYIIRSGAVQISTTVDDKSLQRYLYEGDYFGESCFFDSCDRTTNALAMQDTTLMVIHRDDFFFVFGNKKTSETQAQIITQLLGMQENRNKFISVISKYSINHLSSINSNKFYQTLTSSQKQELEILLNEIKSYEQGEIIWNQGVMAEFSIFVLNGKVQVSVPDNFNINRDTNGYVKITPQQIKVKKNKRESLPLSFVPLKFDKRLRKESNPHIALGFLQHQHQKMQQLEQIQENQDEKPANKQTIIAKEGQFVSEVDSIMNKKKLNTVVEALEDCELIFIKAEALSSFLQANPGLQILFKDALVIE